MIADLDELIEQLRELRNRHGNAPVAIGILDSKEYIREEQVGFVSYEYSGKVVLFGEDIEQ